MIKKYKIEIIIFLSAFLLYFVIGSLLSYYLDTAKYWNVLFDLDTPRVLGDLSIKDYNHYRAAVHPLFLIIFQPIVYVVKSILGNPIISILMIQSFLSSLSLLLTYLILGKMNVKNHIRIFLTILFGFSFGQIVFSSAIETYIYAQAFLIGLWFFTVNKIDKEFNLWDYIILVILGIGSLAITLTNFIQFLVIIFFLILLNKKIKKRWAVAFSIFMIVISISVLLAEVQNVIWPSAPDFFSKGLNDLITGNSEEKLYISKNVNFRSIINVLESNFSHSFNISSLHFPKNGYLAFESTKFTAISSLLLGLIFAIMNFIFIVKTKFNISKHKFYYALATVYIFNFSLHLIYGNSISFMYICHYNFIIILIFAYIFNYFKLNFSNNKYLLYLLSFIVILLSVKNIISMFEILFPLYNHIEYFRIFPTLIIAVAAVALIFLIIKNKYVKLIIAIIALTLLFIMWRFINIKPDYSKDNVNYFKGYSESLNIYKKQLKDMKNDLLVRYYSDRKSPIGIYFFGMADRPKILYKDGKLINIKTKEILKSFEYVGELIVPNEYCVLLRDKNGNDYKIFETREGIYFSKNNVVEAIFDNGQEINLPEFEDSKYSEILKVVHQEVLFNIDGDIPKPNLITYSGAWYRDTMLAVKVLEETKNTNLLKKWVTSVDSIYDYQRYPGLKEVDNLGELLYIIGAVDVKRDDLIEKIVMEINSLRQTDGSIKGSVDGENRSFYPTVLALYGAKKVGINMNLTIPNTDDGYAKLAWYYEVAKPFKTTVDSRYYPYIGWAFYNTDFSGKPYILDEIYPLSYEGGFESGPNRVESECFISEYYCEQKVFLSHMWHASEMFLLLKQY